MKPTDKAALGAVSESPGRNESEPIGGLDTINPKAKPFGSGEGSMTIRSLIEAEVTSAGCSGQHGGKDMSSNWRNRPRPSEKSLEQGTLYNRRNRESEERRDGDG